MTPLRKKQAAGAAAAALLLLGSAYAWRNANQHKTNELRDNLNGNNDVTLVENFIPITDWLEGQEINKDISVKNDTSVETGNNAYVRIQLKEFLEFTNKQEDLSTVRYAVTTAGDFAKFETQAEAQTYATANNLTGAPVQVATTAFEGDDYWFIPTNAEATHGQYGKFLVLKVGDGTSKSIIDEAVKNASADASSKHQAITHGEDLYTTQTFGATGTDINAKRYYDSGKLVTDYPKGGGIEAGKDLKDSSRSRLKSIIDAYYNHLTDKAAVQAVTLNTPTLTAYLSTANNGFDGTGSDYTSWEWVKDSADGDRRKFYRDARFETTVGSGKKQAFALSYGDIHGAIGISTEANNNTASLLNFSGANRPHFWLRSAGYYYSFAGGVGAGNLSYGFDVYGNLPVRPALYLSIN